MQQLGRCQHGPHAIESSPELGDVAQRVAQSFNVWVFIASSGCKRGNHFGFHPTVRSVVPAVPSASFADDSCRLLLAKAQKAGAKRNDQIFSQRSFAVAHSLRDKIHHPHIALNALRQFRFG